jgi:hypothetical protein
MRHVIREIITLIRIERWLVADDRPGGSDLTAASEHVVEQIVLSGADEAQVRELFRRILEERRWELPRDDIQADHSHGRDP